MGGLTQMLVAQIFLIGRGFTAACFACLICVLSCGWIVSAQAQIAFEDISATANIDHKGESWSVAWGDANGDGFQDIFVVNHGTVGGAPPSLYINQGDGTFLDVYQDRFPFLKRDFHGSAWADFDNDGDQDLFISSGGSEGFAARDSLARESDANVFWVQDESGFVDQAEVLDLAEPLARGRAPVWWDVNKDGRVDIVLTKAASVRPESLIYLQSPEGTFQPCETVFESDGRVESVSAIAAAHLLGSDLPHMAVKVSGLGLKLFRAAGDCRFVEAMPEAFSSLKANEFIFADLNGDLRAELITVRAQKHDYVSLAKPNLLAIQYTSGRERLRRHTFSTSGVLRRVRIAPAGPSAWSNDKIFIGAGGIHPDKRPFSLDSDILKHQGLSSLDDVEEGVAIGYLPESGNWAVTVKTRKESRDLSVELRSTAEIGDVLPKDDVFDPIQAGAPDRIFTFSSSGLEDVSDVFGWETPTSCRTLASADFDNDGDLDVYLGCQGEVANLPNRLFQNVGGAGLREVLNSGAGGAAEGLTDSVSVGDFDNDGFLDLFLTNGAGRLHVANGPHQLLRNLGNDNHWVKFDLAGTRSARDAYGARVFVTAGGRTQMRDFTGGIQFGSQHDPRVHFGLGSESEITEVIVQWPVGSMERFTNLVADQIHVLTEGQGISVDRVAIVTSRNVLNVGEEVTLIALADNTLDQSSLKWFWDGDQILENCVACSFTFRQGQTSRVSVSGRFMDGRPFSVEKSLVVQ